MKLSDIVTEQQLDELDAGSIGRGIGAVSRGVGAVASLPQGIGRAVKKGYQAGVNAIGGAPAADTGVEKQSGGFMSSFKAGLKGNGPQDDGVKGTLNTKELAKILPGVDAAALAKAVAVVKAGGEPSISQQKILSNAFIAMLKADPAATTKAATLLKRVSGEAPAAQAPAAQAPAAQAPAAAQAKPNPTTVAAQTRTGKQAVAAKAAQDQMAANPAATKTAPQTPDQIRAGKQAAAGTTARAQMAANPAAPKPAAAQTPDQIRAAKQAAAGKTAQDQMAANPAAPKAAAPQTPDQIRAGKQATAGKTAQDQMAANPAAPKATTAAPTAATVNKTAPDELGRIEPTIDPVSSAPGRPQGGGKVAGKLSDNPSAVKRRDQRQAKSSAPGAAAFGNMASQLGKGNEKNYQATLDKNIAAQKTAADPAAVPGATTTTPSGEKVLANPVATVGTKRATNIGKQTFDAQTGKSLPGQALNNVRKKAEYGSNALGAVRQKIKSGAATLAKPATGTESVDYSIRESRSIFTK